MTDSREEDLLRSLALKNAKTIMLARQRVEEELLRAKDFYDVVMANMGEGLYAVDARGCVTYMNPAAERLLGWMNDELRGRKMHEATHYKHHDGTPFPADQCAGLRVLHDGIALKDCHDWFIRKDATFIPVIYGSSPIRSGDKVVGLVVVFRDATEQLNAEQAQLNLAAIVESSDDAIVSKDLNGIIRSWNKGAERIFGYTKVEVIGKSITVLLPADRLEEETEILRRLRRGESIGHFDTVRRHKSGWLIDVSVTISPIRDSTGQVIGASKIGRDISARRRIEHMTRFIANVNAVLAELTDFESTLQKVARLAVPVFADWCAVDMAEADGSVRRLALMHADSAKLQLVKDIRRQYPPQPSDAFGVMKVLRTREPDWAAEITEELLPTSLRNPEHLKLIQVLGLRSYICVPLHSRSKTIGALTFATAESGRNYTADDVQAAIDLAHRLVIAIENSNLVSALKESDRRKDEFLAILAHELRNPLAPIRSAIDIMRTQGPALPDVQWARDVVDRQLDQMTRLVDDLLDVSRITRGKIELRKEQVSLATVVALAVEASRPLMETHRHELTIGLPPEPIILSADRVRLAQVLSNLLNNAAKYMEEGGHIWLTGERVDDRVSIRVKDTGVGISAEMLPHIFDMFTQVDHSLERSQGGLGIGLTLVQRLIALHGGTVRAFSAGTGKGSEFVVNLPATTPDSVVAPVNASSDLDKSFASAPLLRILVVDDNKDAANGLAKLLRILGHDVHTAYDGMEALGAASIFKPDVAILDIGLPKLNGYEVAQRIRAERGNQIIMIAVTGWGQENDRRRSKEAGFDCHITKPIEFSALKRMLASVQPQNC